MNWGKALALALIAFAGMMAFFVYKASQNPMPLVSENYYGDELRFQERMAAVQRASELSAPVRVRVQRNRVSVDFPEEARGQELVGEMQLQRPNEPLGDHTAHFTVPGTASLEQAGMELLPGRYNLLLLWKMNGLEYCTQERVVVP